MTYKKLRSYFKDNKEYFPQTLSVKGCYYNNVNKEATILIDQIDAYIKANGREAANNHRPTLAALGNLNKLKIHLENLEGWDIPKPPQNPAYNRFDGEIIIPVKKKTKRK